MLRGAGEGDGLERSTGGACGSMAGRDDRRGRITRESVPSLRPAPVRPAQWIELETEGPVADDCLFCRIVNRDIPADVVWESEDVLAFRDISPQAPTHVLVIPKTHLRSLADASDQDGDVLGKVMLAARDVARAEGVGDGFRLVVNTGEDGGQTVFHLHAHVLGGRGLTWPPG